jgi:arsenite-transporting ATPase
LILFTGGGGAGVTTLAAATAALMASRGAAVLLLGAEHEALEAAVGPPGARLAGLRVSAPDPEAALGEDGAELTAWLRSLLAWAGLDDGLIREVALLPAVRLLSALVTAASEGEGVAVVDLGPIAGALPLLHLLATDPTNLAAPEGPGRLVARLAGPIVSRLADLPQPSSAARGAGRQGADRLARLRALLRDTAAASLRLALPADPRARRIELEACTVAGLHGIGLDALVHRRPAPPSADDGPTTLHQPWCDAPPVGPADLVALGRAVYTGRDPAAVLASPRVPRIELVGTGAVLALPLPPRPAGEFRVTRNRARLTIQAGDWRRTVTLPHAIQSMTGRRAWHDGATFRVAFEP